MPPNCEFRVQGLGMRQRHRPNNQHENTSQKEPHKDCSASKGGSMGIYCLSLGNGILYLHHRHDSAHPVHDLVEDAGASWAPCRKNPGTPSNKKNPLF